MAAVREIVVKPRSERGLGSLFGDLTREASRLFRQEIALAKAELSERVGQMGSGVAELVIGGVVLFAGLLALLAAAILALALVIPAWAAALAVAVVVILVGGGIALKGKRDLRPGNLVPQRTLRSLREDADWAREQMR